MLPTGGRKNENVGAVEFFFLEPKLADASGKSLIDHFPVEGDHARAQVFEFLREEHAAFGKFLALQFVRTARGAFAEIGHADPEFEDAAIVFVADRLGNHAGFIHQRPELVATPRVVVAHASGTVAGIGPDENHFHAFAKIVRKSAHWSFGAVTE